VPTERLPLAEGRVTFIRRVSTTGTVTVLSQTFPVGKRHRGLYLRLVVDTGHGWLTAYLNGRMPAGTLVDGELVPVAPQGGPDLPRPLRRHGLSRNPQRIQ
jgi:hypothetical protein